MSPSTKIARAPWTVAALSTLLLAPLSLGCGGESAAPSAAGVDLEAYRAGRYHYPAASWAVAERPAELGWSAEKLAAAHDHFDGLESAAVMVVHRGIAIAAWGEVDERYNVQSVRKSLLGALLGQEIAAGRLGLDDTLAELGIDDDPPLTPEERRATVLDLLGSRSGIYHSALYEAGYWKRNKPERGSDPPGARFYYNNWDFNALGTIFERSAGVSIERAFGERIAEPLGMEDFREKDVVHLSRDSLTERIMDNESDHEAYVFSVTARDLARFGLLYAAAGRWGGERVLPESWVERSWSRQGDAGEEVELGGLRYGLLWWIYPPESGLGREVGAEVYMARGSRGQRLAVIPAHDLVVVHLVATGGVDLASQLKRRFLGADEVEDEQVGRLFGMIAAARPGAAP